jgi:hypothetical protein
MKKIIPYLALLGIIFSVLQFEPKADAQGGGFPPPVAPIVCTAACNVSALIAGQTAYIYQSSFTTKSTTGLAADTVFQFTSLPVGTYVMSLTATGSGAATTYGVLYAFQFTGSGTGYYTNNVFGSSSGCVGGTIFATGCQSANFPASETLTVGMSGFLANTTSATLEVSWAPSAANSTTLGPGIFQVTRIQ